MRLIRTVLGEVLADSVSYIDDTWLVFRCEEDVRLAVPVVFEHMCRLGIRANPIKTVIERMCQVLQLNHCPDP